MGATARMADLPFATNPTHARYKPTLGCGSPRPYPTGIAMPYIPNLTTSLDGLLRRHITATTAVLSLVVGVSGVILFFHLARGSVRTIHEWLGLVFVAVTLLHILRHRSSFASLLRQPRTHVQFAGAALILAMLALALPTHSGGSATHRMAQIAQAAPLSHLAPVIGITEQDLLDRLQAGGIPAVDPTQSLTTIAAIHHVEPNRLMTLALGSP